MESLFILIPLVLIFSIVIAVFYLWSVKSGQYDDLEKEASQILFEEDNLQQQNKHTNKSNNKEAND